RRPPAATARSAPTQRPLAMRPRRRARRIWRCASMLPHVLESMHDANTRDCYVFVIAVTEVARARGPFGRVARIGEAVASSDGGVGGWSPGGTKNASRA